MAHSPSEAVDSSEADAYLKSWTALASMIVRGRSLSGNERNCAYLNTGPSPTGAPRRFADISAASGLDFLDDGRALAATDWDGDGDLDLWLTNREAPRVRFVKNNMQHRPGSAWVAFSLQGTSCNRDAVGARLELEFEGRTHTRVLHTGEGFLSQSSKRLHIGLGTRSTDATSARLTVHWPGGASETYDEVALNQVHKIIQGDSQTTPLPSDSSIALAATPASPQARTDAARILLTARIPAAKIEYVDFGGELQSFDPDKTGNQPTLINTWASWCTPCVTELADFKEHFAQLQAKGLNIIALTTEAVSADGTPASLAEAKVLVKRNNYPFKIGATDTRGLRLLTVLHNQVIVLERPLPLPSSFLIDRHGRLAAIYKGAVTAEQLLADLDLLESTPNNIAAASFPFTSRSGFELFSVSLLHFAKAYQEGGYHDDARLVARQMINAKTTGNARADAAARARAWYFLGNLEQSNRDWKAAADAYGKALEIAPGNPLMEVVHGVVLWQNGEQEEADRAFARASGSQPNNPQVLDALAKSHLQIGRPKLAISYLKKALAIKPGDQSLALTLALAHDKNGEQELAIEGYLKLIQAKPGSIDIKNNLAWLLATTPDDSLRDGQRALALAMEINEATNFSNPVPLDTLATAYAEVGDFSRAIETLRKAIEIARTTGRDSLIIKLGERIALYQSGKPYRSN